MRKYQNNYAFIDGNNLYQSIREQKWILDYKRFRKYLYDQYGVTNAFLFIGYIDTNENLYTALQKQGYILVFRPTLRLSDGRRKGNVDTELVLYAMIEYPNYEKAIIVAGDGDYYCLIEYLKKQDKLLRLLVPNQYKYSSLLRKFTPNIAFLNQMKAKLEYKER